MGWLKFLSPSSSSRRQQQQHQHSQQKQRQSRHLSHASKEKLHVPRVKANGKTNHKTNSNNGKRDGRNDASSPYLSKPNKATRLEVMSPTLTESLSASFESDNFSMEENLTFSTSSESSSTPTHDNENANALKQQSGEGSFLTQANISSSITSSPVDVAQFPAAFPFQPDNAVKSTNVGLHKDGKQNVPTGALPFDGISKSKSESKNMKGKSNPSTAAKNLLSNIHEDEDIHDHTRIQMMNISSDAQTLPRMMTKMSKSKKKSKVSSAVEKELNNVQSQEEKEKLQQEKQVAKGSSPCTASESSIKSSRSKSRSLAWSTSGNDGSTASISHAQEIEDASLKVHDDASRPSTDQVEEANDQAQTTDEEKIDVKKSESQKGEVQKNEVEENDAQKNEVQKKQDKTVKSDSSKCSIRSPDRSSSSSKTSKRSSRSSKTISSSKSVMIMITNLPAIDEPNTLPNEGSQSDIATANESFLGSEFSADQSSGIENESAFYKQDEFSLDPTLPKEDSGHSGYSLDLLNIPSLESTDDEDSDKLSFTDSLFAESDGEENDETDTPHRQRDAVPNTKSTENSYRTSAKNDTKPDEGEVDQDKYALPSRGPSGSTNSTGSSDKLSFTDSIFDEDDTDLSASQSHYSTFQHKIPPQDKKSKEEKAPLTKMENRGVIQEEPQFNTDTNNNTIVDFTQYLQDTTDSGNKKMDDSLLVDDSLLIDDSLLVSPTKSQATSDALEDMSFSDSIFAESDDGQLSRPLSSSKRHAAITVDDNSGTKSKSNNTPVTDFSFDWEAFLENNTDDCDLRSGKSNLSNMYDMTPIMEDAEGEMKEEEEMVLEKLDELDQGEENGQEDFVDRDIFCLKPRPGMEYASTSTITVSAASEDAKKIYNDSTYVFPKYTAPINTEPVTIVNPRPSKDLNWASSSSLTEDVEEKKEKIDSSGIQEAKETEDVPPPPKSTRLSPQKVKDNDGSASPLPPMALPWLTQAFKEAASPSISEIKSQSMTPKTHMNHDNGDDRSWRLTEESIPLRSSNRSLHSAPDLVVEASSLPMEQSTMKVVETAPQHLTGEQEANLFTAYHTAYSEVTQKKKQLQTSKPEEHQKDESRSCEDTKPSTPSHSRRSNGSSLNSSSFESETSDTVQYMIHRLREEAVRRRTRLGRSGDGSVSIYSGGSNSTGSSGRQRGETSKIPSYVVQLNDKEPIDKANK